MMIKTYIGKKNTSFVLEYLSPASKKNDEVLAINQLFSEPFVSYETPKTIT